MTNILYARRTPIARFMGGLANVSAPMISKPLIVDARQTLAVDTIDEIIIGQVLTAGCGQAPARQAAIYGGLADSVCATTINRVCGSGLKSVMLADQAIKIGDAKLIFAGGQENMSLAPYLLPGARRGYRFGESTIIDHLQYDGLRDAYQGTAMGDCGELCAKKYHFSRQEQDDYALCSYQRARDAWAAGHFADEIVAVPTAKGDFDKDEEPFAVDLQKLTRLRPAFDANGTITAGNASSISDGAALLVLADDSLVADRRPLARIVAQASHAQQPNWFTTAPIGAITKVCAKAGLKVNDIDLFEINEAFAVVPMAIIRELELDPAKVNIHGGAVALGHPIGASGSRVLVTLIHALATHGKHLGLATLCIGGGEASAVIVERL